MISLGLYVCDICIHIMLCLMGFSYYMYYYSTYFHCGKIVLTALDNPERTHILPSCQRARKMEMLRNYKFPLIYRVIDLHSTVFWILARDLHKNYERVLPLEGSVRSLQEPIKIICFPAIAKRICLAKGKPIRHKHSAFFCCCLS